MDEEGGDETNYKWNPGILIVSLRIQERNRASRASGMSLHAVGFRAGMHLAHGIGYP